HGEAGGPRLLQRDGSRYAYRLTPKGVQSLPRRRPGSRSSSCSSTNACAARSPIAASTTVPTPAPAGQQTRSRLPPRRQRHPTDRRSTRRLTSAPRLLNSSCLRFSRLESKGRRGVFLSTLPTAGRANILGKAQKYVDKRITSEFERGSPARTSR